MDIPELNLSPDILQQAANAVDAMYAGSRDIEAEAEIARWIAVEDGAAYEQLCDAGDDGSYHHLCFSNLDAEDFCDEMNLAHSSAATITVRAQFVRQRILDELTETGGTYLMVYQVNIVASKPAVALIEMTFCGQGGPKFESRGLFIDAEEALDTQKSEHCWLGRDDEETETSDEVLSALLPF